ncbi:hypothetical protein BJ166DRAFT_489214 [Pestalotiopsis sp. NC0098]|nr:hypothetical protein BJ166DRAFT_489214 [Pestalotiopsis sp. NC0098]
MEAKKEVPIYVDLQGNYHPAVFDLSGKVPFELYMQTRRSVTSESDWRQMIIRRNGSVFDLPAALDKGLLELIDEDTQTAVRRPESEEQGDRDRNDLPAQISESFIKLPTDIRGKDRPIQSVPLEAAAVLRPMVQAGRRYKLRLRGNDLGVQWWAWNSPTVARGDFDISAYPQTSKLVSTRPSWSRSFQVVSEIAMPPNLTIKLALAKEGHAPDDGDDSGINKPSPAISVTITNTHDRPVTVKTSGDQHHLLPRGEVMNPRSRVTATAPDLKNFSIIDQDTQEELASDAPSFLSPAPGGGKLLRKQLLTLAPGEQIDRTVRLPGQRMTVGKEYRISLRSTGCWWSIGTVDDLFGDETSTSKAWPTGPVLPMPLESDDVVLFKATD